MSLKRYLIRTTTPLSIAVATLGILLVFTQLVLASIAQGFVSGDPELAIGMAAAYTSSDEETVVVRTNVSNSSNFVGIVTTETNNLVTLKNTDNDIILTTNGEVPAYVSDLNGEISPGDYLVASPLLGILIKADANDQTILATALEGFTKTTLGAQKTEVTKTDGQKISANIGVIKIDVSPKSLATKSDNESSFLQVIGAGIVGRTISNWQVATVMIIFLLLLVVEGSLVYGAIHGSIIALGRNPLAKEAVYRQLLQAVAAVGIVFIFGSAIIYFVLQI